MFKHLAFKNYISNDYFSTALILLSIVGLIAFTGTLSRVDNLIFDIGQKLHQTPAPADVVIVAIDEESLSKLGRWPWSRRVHAELINRLSQAGASAIGLDIVFSEPESTDADAALSKAISKAKNVVLPVLIEETRANGQYIETLPLPLLVKEAADLGRTHVALDEDGIARSVYMYEGVGAPVWQHFSQAILNVAQQQASKNNFALAGNKNANSIFSLVRNNQQRISFIGPAGHFSTISYAQVYKGEFAQAFFNNKIVLVGATASGMNDLLSTPVSGLGQPMAGVEVHANILQSIREHRLISVQSHKIELVVLALLALLPLLWLPKLSALKGLIATLSFFMLVTFIAALLPKLLGIWIAPSAALLAILIAYPIWSWRKLEAANRYLDVELAYLRHNLHLSKTDIIAKQSDTPVADYVQNFDSFDARIEQVRSASEQLRFLQEDRKETLAFISHDLRAPLARALMMVDGNAELKEKLHTPLSQAFDLAEDFLQTSRAEMLDGASFKELDFAGLTHQAVDEAYESAGKKNIMLARDIPDAQIWLNGNFGLLQRAILNLLLNAVKFSPENTAVQIKLHVKYQQAILSVTNLGAGISAQEQTQLFKRFSRLQGGQTARVGAGLGLYFVQTVAEKHQGTVEVESILGQSTNFTLRLPIVR